MESNGGTDPTRPFNGTRPAKVVEKDFYDTIDDVVKHSGTKFPTWNRTKPKVILVDSCAVGDHKGTKFSIYLEGGPVIDSDKAIATMKAHWESLDYTIGLYFPDMGANTTGRQLNATSPVGAEVQFTPAEDGSSISVESECTLDPAATERHAPTDTAP
ncbi:hypothetical protein FHU41_000516 [Psychromicrobium silvestre]|uniref:Uncharacterized protein n=1 Tax=Psychromicrobium silvestre TaxID=1645614 RepID=A0A7Y9S534_9MICC|nr:hypothetical protein [Psychromicrobium silvestre]NYE94295.1 hypothetical protein [Psychromicrobium silvestre]